VSGLKAYVKLTARDREGRVVQQLTMESRSFLFNLIKVLRALFSAQHSNPIVLLDGSEGRFDAYCFVDGGTMSTNWWCHLMAPKEDDSFGVVVGNGTTPVAIDDYNLESKILHGEGMGRLYYWDVKSEEVVVDGNTIKFKVKRVFEERAGSSVDVKEVGLIAFHRCTDDNGDTQIKFLIARDVLTSTVTVPAQGTLLVEYEISCTV